MFGTRRDSDLPAEAGAETSATASARANVRGAIWAPVCGAADPGINSCGQDSLGGAEAATQFTLSAAAVAAEGRDVEDVPVDLQLLHAEVALLPVSLDAGQRLAAPDDRGDGGEHRKIERGGVVADQQARVVDEQDRVQVRASRGARERELQRICAVLGAVDAPIRIASLRFGELGDPQRHAHNVLHLLTSAKKVAPGGTRCGLMATEGHMRSRVGLMVVLLAGCGDTAARSAGGTSGGPAETDGTATSGSPGGDDSGGESGGPEAEQDAPLQRLHRLNCLEYDNTVRDLLGTSLRPSSAFGPDPEANGFDNMAAQL